MSTTIQVHSSTLSPGYRKGRGKGKKKKGK